MNDVKFKKLIKRLKDEQSRADSWIDRVPLEISAAFFDNPYVNSWVNRADFLLSVVFQDNPDLLKEVEWFLYDWDADKDVSLRTITVFDECVYVINDLDDFIKYLLSQRYIHND